MQYYLDETICAIASPPEGALRGIIRLSGPQLIDCLDRCFEPQEDRSSGQLRNTRRPTVIQGSLRAEPPVGQLPCQLYLWPDSRSYTRQPSAEIHTIGSPPLLEAAQRALCASGARLAGPGEFTLRAFLAGRLDLTQAEAVLGVIDAASRSELDVALRQLAGGLADPLNHLRDHLLDLLAHLEAGLDFVEEEIEFITTNQLNRQLTGAVEQIESMAARMTSRRQATLQPRVVLVGSPNVGKSSLLNALAGESAALVDQAAGTTRDYLCRSTDLDGASCLLIDTAGIEAGDHANAIVSAAQQAADLQRQQAHLTLFCIDSTRAINDWEREQINDPHHSKSVTVLTKSDLPGRTDYAGQAIATSSHSGAGLEELRHAIRRRIADSAELESGVVAGTAARCGECLRAAAQSLSSAQAIVTQGLGEELAAAEIRHALDQIGSVVGAVYTDDVLDRIFSRFCIGK